MLNDLYSCSKAISPNTVTNQGLKNLLSAASADTQGGFQFDPADPREGKRLKFPDRVSELTVPKRSIWHHFKPTKYLLRLCTCAKYAGI